MQRDYLKKKPLGIERRSTPLYNQNGGIPPKIHRTSALGRYPPCELAQKGGDGKGAEFLPLARCSTIYETEGFHG